MKTWFDSLDSIVQMVVTMMPDWFSDGQRTLVICGYVMCFGFEHVCYLPLNPGEEKRNVFKVVNKSNN